MHSRHSAILVALTAAALFGAATPLAKALIGAMSPFMVAGLFYLGSGVGPVSVSCFAACTTGMTTGAAARCSAQTCLGWPARLQRAEWPARLC